VFLHPSFYIFYNEPNHYEDIVFLMSILWGYPLGVFGAALFARGKTLAHNIFTSISFQASFNTYDGRKNKT